MQIRNFINVIEPLLISVALIVLISCSLKPLINTHTRSLIHSNLQSQISQGSAVRPSKVSRKSGRRHMGELEFRWYSGLGHLGECSSICPVSASLNGQMGESYLVILPFVKVLCRFWTSRRTVGGGIKVLYNSIIGFHMFHSFTSLLFSEIKFLFEKIWSFYTFG